MTTTGVAPDRMRHVMGHFASGVTVVTGVHDGEPVGFSCQSFSSVSLDPPLVLVCPARTSSSWPRIAASGSFVVNVLAAEQEDLCRRFASSGGDKFDGVGWTASPWGPVLHGVLASVHCDLEVSHDAGDHVIAVGAVRELEVVRSDGAPLLFFKGAFGKGSA